MTLFACSAHLADVADVDPRRRPCFTRQRQSVRGQRSFWFVSECDLSAWRRPSACPEKTGAKNRRVLRALAPKHIYFEDIWSTHSDLTVSQDRRNAGPAGVEWDDHDALGVSTRPGGDCAASLKPHETEYA